MLWGAGLLAAAFGAAAAPQGAQRAERVYRSGIVFTANARQPSVEALAIREGRIVYVGADDGLAAFIGRSTETIDLHGRFLMAGLVDAHMHPLRGGTVLLKCSLDYAPTVAQLQARVQACLDQSATDEPDGWLEVVGWFQESMRPAGVTTSHATLDARYQTYAHRRCRMPRGRD